VIGQIHVAGRHGDVSSLHDKPNWQLLPIRLLLRSARLLGSFYGRRRNVTEGQNDGEEQVCELPESLDTGASSLRAIAAELNAREIPTPRRLGEWSAVQVKRMMERSTFLV
jgi:hypothetical protein